MEKNGQNGTFFSKEWKRNAGTEHSFQKNEKERPERNVLFIRTEKNDRNGTFFSKEWKRTDGTERSFQKNGCPSLLNMMSCGHIIGISI